MESLEKNISIIKKQIKDSRQGLPEEVFLLVSSLTPLVNVDLLIVNEINEVLLSWRDDIFAGKGWHIPGGIIRYKEKLEDRIIEVALKEISSSITYKKEPIAINEIFCNHEERGHFISFLYECRLPVDFKLKNNVAEDEPGYLKWHAFFPENMIESHKIYRDVINKYTRR